MGSVGDVSRVFEVAVSHGLGTNPAAVLLFRRRSPSIFLLGLSGGLQATRSQRSAAWAVALKSGSAVLRRRPSHLWL